MNFRASLCDPLKPDIIELGILDKDKVIETFEQIQWNDLLKKLEGANEKDIYFSPSFGIESTDNKTSLSLSLVEGTEWYIFFKRPKLIKQRKWFKTVEYMDAGYLSNITGQSIEDVKECLEAFIRNDLKFLEEKIN